MPRSTIRRPTKCTASARSRSSCRASSNRTATFVSWWKACSAPGPSNSLRKTLSTRSSSSRWFRRSPAPACTRKPRSSRACSRSTSSCRPTCRTAMLAAVKKDDPSRLADTIGAHLNVDLHAKQDLLEIVDIEARLDKLIEVVTFEIEKLRVDKKNPGPGKEADGTGPEGVLPQREDESDPARAGTQRRPGLRGRPTARPHGQVAGCRPKSWKRPSRSSSGWRPCHRCRRRPPCRATTSTGCVGAVVPPHARKHRPGPRRRYPQ